MLPAVAELNPQKFLAHLFGGLCYIQIGRFNDSILACETAAKLHKRSPFTLAYLGVAYAISDRIVEARILLVELEDIARNQYVLSSSLAIVYIDLGEIDKGFDWIDKAIEERNGHILHIHIDPQSSSLRSHPRYQSLLQKMNLKN